MRLKTFLLAILMVLVFVTTSFATDYYAGKAATNINADDLWFTTSTGSCGGSTGASGATALQAGNTLYANGCDVTVNASFTATKISTAAGAGTSGGSFNVVTSTSPLTITAAVEGGATSSKPGLVITGNANANPALTIIGDITGGSASGAHGVSSSYTVGTIIIQGAITGGSHSGTNGYYSGSNTGTVEVTGNVSGATGPGLQIVSSAAGSKVTGNCIGSTGNVGVGCTSAGSGGLKIYGNIINNTRSVGAHGSVYWNPSATNYLSIKTTDGSTVMYLPSTTNLPVTNVKTGVEYGYDGSTGPNVGTLSAGGAGGGTWGF